MCVRSTQRYRNKAHKHQTPNSMQTQYNSTVLCAVLRYALRTTVVIVIVVVRFFFYILIFYLYPFFLLLLLWIVNSSARLLFTRASNLLLCFFSCVTCFLCYALISGPTANQQSNIISLTKQLCNIHAQPCTQSQRIINVQFPYCHST